MQSIRDDISIAAISHPPADDEIININLCDTPVWITPLPSCHEVHPSSVRRLEKAAVQRLVTHVFGENALISHTSAGAPYIQGYGCRISVTHGSGFAAMAVSDENVGVDIESPRPQLARVAGRFLNTRDSLSATSPLYLLQWAWTIKEAVYKAALTPGLSLTDIVILSAGEAETIPDGKHVSYRLASVKINDAILTVARPKRPSHLLSV